jgi:hypothetical protein
MQYSVVNILSVSIPEFDSSILDTPRINRITKPTASFTGGISRF